MTDEHVGAREDDPPSEEELAHATALARALERETLREMHVDALLPALEARHLLNLAKASEPSEARLAELYRELEVLLPRTSEVSAKAAASTIERDGWRGIRKWLLVATSVGLAAASGLWLGSQDAATPRTLAELPAPTLAILEAQQVAMQQPNAANPADANANGQSLTAAMRPYRAEFLTRLATEYGP